MPMRLEQLRELPAVFFRHDPAHVRSTRGLCPTAAMGRRMMICGGTSAGRRRQRRAFFFFGRRRGGEGRWWLWSRESGTSNPGYLTAAAAFRGKSRQPHPPGKILGVPQCHGLALDPERQCCYAEAARMDIRPLGPWDASHHQHPAASRRPNRYDLSFRNDGITFAAPPSHIPV